MTWKPLPEWALAQAQPVEVKDLDRLRSLCALRTLSALHIMAAFTSPDNRDVTCSARDLMSYSGLSRSSTQKGIRELVEARVILASPWIPGQGPLPKTYTL